MAECETYIASILFGVKFLDLTKHELRVKEKAFHTLELVLMTFAAFQISRPTPIPGLCVPQAVGLVPFQNDNLIASNG